MLSTVSEHHEIQIASEEPMKVLIKSLFFALLITLGFASMLPLTTSAQNTANEPATSTSGDTAQYPDPQVAAKLRERGTYSGFFSHLKGMEETAEKMDAEGKRGDDYRYLDQRRAGLTRDEGELMTQVLHEYQQAREEHWQKVKNFLADRGIDTASHPNALVTSNTPGENPQIHPDMNEIIDSAIAQLKQGLGEKSFAKLDRYVRELLGVHDKDVPVANPTHTFVPRSEVKSPTIDQDRRPR